MQRKIKLLMLLGFLIAMTTSANAQVLYDWIDTPNNVAILGNAYGWGDATSGTPTVFNNASAAIDRLACVGEPGTASWNDNMHYYNWPDVAGSGTLGIYSLEIQWDTAYDLTTLNAYVCSGDTVGHTDTDRIVSNVEFYVNYEPVGTTPIYTSVGSAVPGATDDIACFDLTSISGTWTGVTSVRYDFTVPTPYDATTNPWPQPRIAEVQAIAPGVTVDLPVGYTATNVTIVEEGGTMTAAENLALASNGGVIFSSGTLGDENGWGGSSHTNAGANDGVYGNGSSWIGCTTEYAAYNPTDAGQPFIGVVFDTETTVDSIAFGRNNSENLDWYLDRWAGEYIIQYTDVENPNADTPDTDWTDIGTVEYSLNLEELGMTEFAGSEFYAPYKRHLIEFDPVNATALRIIVPSTGWNGTCIDEFEVYAADVPEPSTIVLMLGAFVSLVMIHRRKRA